MHCSALVQHGSFASIPPICRYSEREGEKKTFSSHRNILLETPITTCLARRPRAPRHRLLRAGACSATARESEISFRRWWPGRLLPSSLSLALPLCSLLPPFRAPSLPPTQSSAFCHRLSGDPQIPAHTHTRTHRPGNVFSSCEITFTTRHSDHTFVVVILPPHHRHLPRTIMQPPCDRDVMPAATSLVSHQSTVQHAYPLAAARFCHLYRLHTCAWVFHKTP